MRSINTDLILVALHAGTPIMASQAEEGPELLRSVMRRRRRGRFDRADFTWCRHVTRATLRPSFSSSPGSRTVRARPRGNELVHAPEGRSQRVAGSASCTARLTDVKSHRDAVRFLCCRERSNGDTQWAADRVTVRRRSWALGRRIRPIAAVTDQNWICAPDPSHPLPPVEIGLVRALPLAHSSPFVGVEYLVKPLCLSGA